jgi:hypothetical protein
MSFLTYIVQCEVCHTKYEKTGGIVDITSMDDGRTHCDCGGRLVKYQSPGLELEA